MLHKYLYIFFLHVTEALRFIGQIGMLCSLLIVTQGVMGAVGGPGPHIQQSDTRLWWMWYIISADNIAFFSSSPLQKEEENGLVCWGFYTQDKGSGNWKAWWFNASSR